MSDFNSANNRAVWFDIPVANLDRAIKFYSSVLGIQVQKMDTGKESIGVLDHKDGNGGCLVENAGEISAIGILVYLNVDGRIRDAISRVTSQGGSIIEPLHSIGPHGFRALVKDSEGNRIALHSNKDA